jgi:hypothetical protein
LDDPGANKLRRIEQPVISRNGDAGFEPALAT